MKTLFFTLLFISLASFAFATQSKKQVKLRIMSPAGYVSETIIYFDLGVVPAFIANQDAPEVYSNIPGIPSIYSISSDNVYCSINGYSPLTTSAVIPLGIKTDTAGGYLFTASMLSNFDSTTIVQLEDRQQNIFTNLGNNFYIVHLTDTGIVNGRFFLHVSQAIQFSNVIAGCANDDGMLQISSDSSVLWSTTALYDSSNVLVSSLNNISGSYSFNHLSEGNYKLVLSYGGDYISTKAMHVNGNYIVAHIKLPVLSALVNQEINFYSLVHNATNYFWDFGDGSQIDGIANPTFAFLQPGVFNVVLTCTNAAGCQYSDSVSITVSSMNAVSNIADDSRNIWAHAKTITVVLNEEIKPGAEIIIYNLLGQLVYKASLTQLTTDITLNNAPNEYYMISLQNNNISLTKRVALIQ